MMEFTRAVSVYDSKQKKYVTLDVRVTIDPQSVAEQLGSRAMRNKSGKSRLAVGITAKATVRDANG